MPQSRRTISSQATASSRAARSQRGSRLDVDVLVIGSGVAGLVYALELAEARPNARIAVVSKQRLGEGNTRWAQGGIAAVGTSDDSVEQHVEDTLQAGAGLCRVEAVESILEAAPRCIERLIQRGVPFDRAFGEGPSGADSSTADVAATGIGTAGYDLALEGGHAHRRVYHAGDRTGLALMKTLVSAVQNSASIEVWDSWSAVDLIVQTPRHSPGGCSEVIGAYLLEGENGRIHRATARVTALATGGAGKVFRYTTNAETATGDGVAMAYRAGARVGNLEFFQFHPTLLYHPRINNFLLTEALRGEGAKLLLPGTEERFMQRYSPRAFGTRNS